MILTLNMIRTTGITELVIITGIFSIFSIGLFGAFGAMVHYLYKVVKEESEYRFMSLLMFFILGFFIAILVDSLSMDFFGVSYEGILLLSGFLVMRILEFLDIKGLGIVLKRVGIKDK